MTFRSVNMLIMALNLCWELFTHHKPPRPCMDVCLCVFVCAGTERWGYDGGKSCHKFVNHYSCNWSELWLFNSFATLVSDLWNSGEQLLWVAGDGCIFQNNTEMWTVNILWDFYDKKVITVLAMHCNALTMPYFSDVLAQTA